MLGKLGGLIGEGPDKTRTAASAAIPAILAGLSGVASKPDGAQRLDATLRDINASDEGHEAAIAAGGSHAAGLAERGIEMLRSLMGEGMMSSILSALGKFGGLGLGPAKSLLGAIAPMVLGMLGRQKQAMGLDAGGISKLLSDQRQNIAGALPSGLGQMLGNIPGLGAITGSLREGAESAAQGAREYAQSATGAVGRGFSSAVDAARRQPSPARWAVPLIVLLGLGLAAWAIWGRKGEEPKDMGARPQQPMAATQPTAGEAIRASGTIPPGTSIPDVSKVTSSLTETFGSLTQTLSGVTDAASADAAIPKLNQTSAQLDNVKAMLDKLPASARSTVASLVDTWLPKIRDTASKATTLPGVGDKLKPAVDELINKMAALSGK
jgi:hypothetical protein